MFDLSVIIVTYNSSEQIGECLRSVYAECKATRQEIIVLDNNSTDTTVEDIKRDFPEVRLLIPGDNLGFAKGVNEAARHASGKYLLLLNPDTVVKGRALDKIYEFARVNPEYGFYGGRTLKPDGTLEPSSCWGSPSLWSLTTFAFGLSTAFKRNKWLDPESLGGWQRDTVREVGVITGCLLLVEKSAWQKLRGFDERYFMYGEDADLAERARREGFKPVIYPDAQVIHEVGMSSSTPIHKMRLLYRGKATYARTHWRGLSQVIALDLLVLGVFIRALPAFLTGKKDNRWRMLWEERAIWREGYAPVNLVHATATV